MGARFDQLNQHLSDIHNLNMAYWMLQHDQNTQMPPAGANARAAQMATLQKLRHELLTSDETARLIEDAAAEIEGAEYGSYEASLIRVAREDYTYASALPTDFVAEYTQATATAFAVWREAKARSDYAHFLPALRKVFELKLREAALRGYGDGHPYDVLLGYWERGMTTAQVRQIFDAHKQALVDLVEAVNTVQDRVDDSLLHQPLAIEKQQQVAQVASTALGFDYDRWAQFGVAPHPYCLQLSRDDIRLTTRFAPNFFNPAFYGTLHETGHGLHARGFAPEIDGTFLSDMESYSHAVCESQSRTWENLVGRSREYWQWFLPYLQQHFPTQFDGATAEDLYRAVNKVRQQYLRVEADELTYNLHIMLRFELEVALVEGKLSLEDASDAWNDTFQAYFGLTPPDDARGILQDVHWSMGGMGAFVGYALGNILAVQYYARALTDHPDIPEKISQGDFTTLREWLTEHIYIHGRKYSADELTLRVTGTHIDPAPYVDYLQRKMQDVYRL